MQKTLDNTADVSLFFLVAFGGLHLSTSLLIAQEVDNSFNVLIFNSLDLPFLLSALVYGSSRLSLALETITGNLKTPLVISGVLSFLVFIGALYLNFGISDANLF